MHDFEQFSHCFAPFWWVHFRNSTPLGGGCYIHLTKEANLLKYNTIQQTKNQLFWNRHTIISSIWCNDISFKRKSDKALTPFGFWLFSKFDYPLKLHHTQTYELPCSCRKVFDYPLKLHHTQTVGFVVAANCWFDYPLKLHHTQTLTLPVNTE